MAECVSRDSPLAIGGDGRADSPGHSAKYGSYGIIDLSTNKVLHIELVQVNKLPNYTRANMTSSYNVLQSNEVKSSNHMELEGLVRALNFLTDNQVQIGTIITDRHKQINKYLREKHPSIEHRYDVWHISKGTMQYLDVTVNKMA